MIFPTRVAGIPCQCEVLDYFKGAAATWTEPPDPPEISFRLRDRKGYPAPWLENKMTPAATDELMEEIHIMVQGEVDEYRISQREFN